jgi:hypothetical protein
VNGILAPPIMALMMLLVRRKAVSRMALLAGLAGYGRYDALNCRNGVQRLSHQPNGHNGLLRMTTAIVARKINRETPWVTSDRIATTRQPTFRASGSVRHSFDQHCVNNKVEPLTYDKKPLELQSMEKGQI